MEWNDQLILSQLPLQIDLLLRLLHAHTFQNCLGRRDGLCVDRQGGKREHEQRCFLDHNGALSFSSEMTNDETRMTKRSFIAHSSFDHSGFFRHSCFVIW